MDGWFLWRSGQEEAAATFPSGSRFVEVGTYLGRSLCSLAEVAQQSGRLYSIIGIDTCLGGGPDGSEGIDHYASAVNEGGGTFAGILHRNLIACGFADAVSVIVSDSETASTFFADASLDWVHVDARHDYDSVRADIAAWLPKVRPGGWLSGDDYNSDVWPGVVGAVRDALPQAQPWSTGQWRWVVPPATSRRWSRWSSQR